MFQDNDNTGYFANILVLKLECLIKNVNAPIISGGKYLQGCAEWFYLKT